MITISSGSVRWHSKDRDLCFLGQKRGRQHLYRLSQVRQGTYQEAIELTSGDEVVDDYSFAKGNFVVIKGTLTNPQDIYRITKPGKYERLTHINPHIDT